MNRQSRRTSGSGAAIISLCLVAAGVLGTLLSGSFLVDAWYERWTWDHSYERQRIDRQLHAVLPDDVGTASRSAATASLQVNSSPAIGTVEEATAPTAGQTESLTGEADTGSQRERPGQPSDDDSSPAAPPSQASNSTPMVSATAEFRFVDPAAPGAHAVVAVTISNRSDRMSQPMTLEIPVAWFDGVSIIGAIPEVLDDRVAGDGHRVFEYPGAPPHTDSTFELHVVADAVVDAPSIRVRLGSDVALGEPPVAISAPSPEVGPVRGLVIPRLGVRTGVVETRWEPPAFIAGQIRETAPLGMGNSVLVGHRSGHAGDVFAPLVRARLGDEIVAVSEGRQLSYIVSEIRTLPGTDGNPIGPTETPRLTLMTCTGTWNPLTGEYSQRLWVIAEPPDLARATLAATVARASAPATRSASLSESARIHTDAAFARAALLLLDPARRGLP